MAKSIITDNMDICYICEQPRECIHHVFGGTANRRLSDKYKLVIPLCHYHHNMSNEGVHFNKPFDICLKKIGQMKFEEEYSHEKFMQVFGRNWL